MAVPAVACWLVGACSLRRARGLARLDAGGLLASGTGLSWLVASGAWHSFLEILLGWNREYANLGFGRATRPMLLLFWAGRFLPWSLVHLPAVRVALEVIIRAVGSQGPKDLGSRSRALLGAFYLSLLAQAMFIQNHTGILYGGSGLPGGSALVATGLRLV